MLGDLLNLPVANIMLVGIAIAGVLIKLMIGSIYKREIKEIQNHKNKHGHWLERVNQNFEKDFGNRTARNVSLFVLNELNSQRICGMNLKSVDSFSTQTPYIILSTAFGFCYKYLSEGKGMDYIFEFSFFTLTLGAIDFAVNKLINNDVTEARLSICLNEYLENNRLPKMLSSEYEKQKLITMNKEDDAVAATMDNTEIKSGRMKQRQRRKMLKAEKLRLKRKLKAEKLRLKKERARLREIKREEARKKSYEEKMRKLREKYGENVETAVSAEKTKDKIGTAVDNGNVKSEMYSEILKNEKKFGKLKTEMEQGNFQTERKQEPSKTEMKYGMSGTEKKYEKPKNNMAAIEPGSNKRLSLEDEKIIEEVLKEYLFRD